MILVFRMGSSEWQFQNEHHFDSLVPVQGDKAARIVKHPEKDVEAICDAIKAILTYHKTIYALVGGRRAMIRLVHRKACRRACQAVGKGFYQAYAAAADGAAGYRVHDRL